LETPLELNDAFGVSEVKPDASDRMFRPNRLSNETGYWHKKPGIYAWIYQTRLPGLQKNLRYWPLPLPGWTCEFTLPSVAG
jgi:hypothetical protein